uniref:Uncharacterized protein n=1 Tax=Arundo donax TaxID=35708 RepID=A0A0A9GE68_ARUDO
MVDANQSEDRRRRWMDGRKLKVSWVEESRIINCKEREWDGNDASEKCSSNGSKGGKSNQIINEGN